MGTKKERRIILENNLPATQSSSVFGIRTTSWLSPVVRASQNPAKSFRYTFHRRGNSCNSRFDLRN